ncbi:MAG: hypothetical protein ACKOYJ_10390 [Planctomycetia bacterium]
MTTSLEQVDAAVIVALSLEASPICDLLSGLVRLRGTAAKIAVGTIGASTVAVVEGGVGRAAAERATLLAIDGHRPRRIIAAGLCGALDPALPRGTVVVPSRLVRVGTSEARPVEPLPGVDASSGASVVTMLLTGDTVVGTPEARRSLRETTGAAAIDMESWWVAGIAAEAGIPCHVVRAVSDSATDTIAQDVAALAAITNPARQAGAAMRLVWRRPSAIGELAELRESAHRAAERLADSLVRSLAATSPMRG